MVKITKSKNRMSDELFGFCSHRSHNTLSEYPKDAIPIGLLKNTKNTACPLFKYCSSCRAHDREVDKVKRNRKREASEKLEGDDNYRYCREESHATNSQHPCDKVPIALFRRIEHPDSKLIKICLDCRKVRREKEKRHKKVKAELVAKRGNFFCGNCRKEKDTNERAINKNGKPSVVCKSCKKRSNKAIENRRKTYNNIKLEFVTKHQASCQKCNSIYIKPLGDASVVRIIEKYNNSGKWMVDCEDNTHPVEKFLSEHTDLLELRILELDHLPESEARRRGIVGDDEEYIPKKNSVSQMSSEETMRLEAAKCQILCSRCHIEETIGREAITKDERLSLLTIKKREYVEQLKKKSGGCASCGFWDSKLLRFLELDHKDPKNKLSAISEMINNKSCTYADMVEECSKCRVLCRHCHIIHTYHQRRSGLIK